MAFPPTGPFFEAWQGDDTFVLADKTGARGTNKVRPVGLSQAFSVTWAVTIPGRSERRPVIELAAITLPADNR